MKIAITGASGMIGSALATLALSGGHEVVAIVRPGSNRLSNLPADKKLTLVECGISDYESLKGRHGCDVFFHLAWDKTSVSGRDDTETQAANIKYTLDSVNLAHSWGASAFIGAGSQAEYGNPGVRLKEDTPVNPESAYGIAKYAAGKLSGHACKQLGMRFCWTRILSVYGELDGEHTLMMYLIQELIKGNAPKLTKCEQIWDYIYSEDAARALMAIGQNGKDGRTYRIGSGACRPLKDFVMDVRDVVNPGITPLFGEKEYYPHQTMFLCADIEDLKKDTGFEPEVGFKEGVSKIAGYIKSKNSP